jgi:hypothetical protein
MHTQLVAASLIVMLPFYAQIIRKHRVDILESSNIDFFVASAQGAFAIGTLIATALAFVTLLKRHFDTNLYWAYFVLACLMTAVGAANLVALYTLAFTFATPEVREAMLHEPVIITSAIAYATAFVYQVRRLYY